MAQATLTARLDPMDKQKFETFCNSVGLTVSGAINLYVKAVLKNYRIPFDISSDPFYSEENMNVLRKSIAQAENGYTVKHDLLEVYSTTSRRERSLVVYSCVTERRRLSAKR